ncbi:MAG TPA: hypothetical protein VMU95_03650 [Trebonia sp.]|nr:hypothetical protein [Trebonia sp.]
MRDLPFDDDEFAGWPPVGDDEFPVHPAESQPDPGYPPEISHQPASPYGETLESAPGQPDWAISEPGDWSWEETSGPDRENAPRGSVPMDSPSVVGRRHVRRRGSRRPARWLVVCAAVVPALAAGGGIALLKATSGGTADIALSGNKANAVPSVGATSGPSPSTSTSPRPTLPASTTPPASTNMGVQVGTGESGPDTLAGVLAAADGSVEGNGLIPPAKCHNYQQNAAGAIVCTAPVHGVAEIFYQNYSSLTALYDAYKAEVAELDGGTFRQNTRTCGDSAVSYAEFGWNQEEGHPHNFTVAQMTAGKVGQLFAAGRMACFATHTAHGLSQDLVWTIDGGPAMGVAIGDGPPGDVYQLWASLHHAVLFRGTEMCGTAPRMNARDIPTGNLKVVPVCPPGVQALPDSPAP